MAEYTWATKDTRQFDVVVCGGGVAGVVAAISAARNGAKVAIVEKNGELGGTSTSALVGPFMTSFEPSGKRQIVKGIFDEIIQRLVAKGAAIHPKDTGLSSKYGCYIKLRHNNVTPFQPAYMTIVLAEMCAESGISIFLNSSIVDVIMEDETIKGIVAFDGENFIEYLGKVVLDCTGDAVVALKSGVECVQGENGDKTEVQPMTLFFWIYGADDKKIEEYLDNDPEWKNQPYHRMIEADRAEGKFNVQRSKIGLYHMVNDGEWRLNTTRIQEMDPSDPEAKTKAYLEGLKQVDFLMDYFKKCPGLENAKLAQVGNMIGIRESRRIVGEYTLTRDDIVGSKEFEDTIALCSYPIDMHPSHGSVIGMGRPEDKDIAPIYEIPYRIMVPKTVEGLLVVGRCVSTDRDALAAIRTMPTVMAMGEAAGVAASLSVKHSVPVKDIDYEEMRQVLRNQGSCIDK